MATETKNSVLSAIQFHGKYLLQLPSVERLYERTHNIFALFLSRHALAKRHYVDRNGNKAFHFKWAVTKCVYLILTQPDTNIYLNDIDGNIKQANMFYFWIWLTCCHVPQFCAEFFFVLLNAIEWSNRHFKIFTRFEVAKSVTSQAKRMRRKEMESVKEYQRRFVQCVCEYISEIKNSCAYQKWFRVFRCCFFVIFFRCCC